jgi:hypothetical protein
MIHSLCFLVSLGTVGHLGDEVRRKAPPYIFTTGAPCVRFNLCSRRMM